ncbi:MAG: TIGR01212 family radical SAM protein [Armatimonadetes bacterium]|nr:TIGR01212 family radical SAM protein [Armatimonadota bacterium]
MREKIRYNYFGNFLKQKFGFNLYKVAVDAGFNCPNRDGTISKTGCIYCSIDSFRPSNLKFSPDLREQIQQGMEYLTKRYYAQNFIIYFQSYTNTYAPLNKLKEVYQIALEDKRVKGLSIGTRPDCINEEKLKFLEILAKDYFINLEYGLQSPYNQTLKFIQRGHSYEVFKEAVSLTLNRGIYITAHIILGFPGETKEAILNTAKEISRLKIDFLKIHQLQVIKGTPLAKIYKDVSFPVFSYQEYLNFICDFLERLSSSIVIQRLFAVSPNEILIAPKWGKTRHQIQEDIHKELKKRNSYQGKFYEN